jgi:hypothetical protein
MTNSERGYSMLGLKKEQVSALQKSLLEIYKKGKALQKPFNYQIVFIWSKMNLNNPDLLGRVLILLKELMTSILSISIDDFDTKEIISRRELSDAVTNFYHLAHTMIDELAEKEN